jgi:hypothetical protein
MISATSNFYFFIKQSLKNLSGYIFSEWRVLGIKKRDIVADFGSGSRPFLRADILIDKFLGGSNERPADFIDTGAYVIECDLSAVPIRDKAVDFSYSNHVIEHLKNIEESLGEIERISKKGYISCPSALRESIVALKMHLWFIEKKDGQLVISEKESPYPKYVGNFFDKLLASRGSWSWSKFEDSFRDIFFIHFFWKEKINFTVRRNNLSQWKTEGESEFGKSKGLILTIRKIIIIALSKIIRFFFSPRKIDILKILCCPSCKFGLFWKNDHAVCCQCGKKFRHKDRRIFYFLNHA